MKRNQALHSDSTWQALYMNDDLWWLGLLTKSKPEWQYQDNWGIKGKLRHLVVGIRHGSLNHYKSFVHYEIVKH